MAVEPKQLTPVHVRQNSTRRALFPPPGVPSSPCSSIDRPKPRSGKIEVPEANPEGFLGADSGGFDENSECIDEKAKKKKRSSFGIFGIIKKGLASKKSRDFENTIEEESDYERAIGLAETALHSLRSLRFSIEKAGNPWNGSEYEEHIQRLHQMESSGEAATATATSESAEHLSTTTLSSTPTLAEWLRIEIDTVAHRRREFDAEVHELRVLLYSMEHEEGQISSVSFHCLFAILHHLHSSVCLDDAWALLVLEACRLLHDYCELRRVVVLLLQVTSATTKEEEQQAEDIRTLLLRVTVGACTQWVELFEWQRDVVCCLLMRRRSSREKRRKDGESSSTTLCSSDRATTLSRRGGMRPGAEEALRHAGIMDAKCREVMEAAAKDLGRRLDAESARLVHGKTRPIFFPSIKRPYQ